jgi:hypothetical protein
MRKCYVIQLASGSFLAPNGDEIDIASEALTFTFCADATKHSFKYIGSRVRETPNRFDGYESSPMLEHVNFVTTRLN